MIRVLYKGFLLKSGEEITGYVINECDDRLLILTRGEEVRTIWNEDIERDWNVTLDFLHSLKMEYFQDDVNIGKFSLKGWRKVWEDDQIISEGEWLAFLNEKVGRYGYEVKASHLECLQGIRKTLTIIKKVEAAGEVGGMICKGQLLNISQSGLENMENFEEYSREFMESVGIFNVEDLDCSSSESFIPELDGTVNHTIRLRHTFLLTKNSTEELWDHFKRTVYYKGELLE